MKIGYFLYDEACSGVIESQALDVVRFFNNETEHNAVLMAALPFRSHRRVKQQFEESLRKPIVSAIALPQKLQVKLHKLEILTENVSARRHADAVAGTHNRVRRGREKLTGAAARQESSGGVETHNL